MPREMPSPIDLPEPDARPALRWAAAVIAIAALLLLLANAVALRDWIEDQPPGPAQARAAELAEAWVMTTEAARIGAPRGLLHAAWKRAEAARFANGAAGAGEGARAPDQR